MRQQDPPGRGVPVPADIPRRQRPDPCCRRSAPASDPAPRKTRFSAVRTADSGASSRAMKVRHGWPPVLHQDASGRRGCAESGRTQVRSASPAPIQVRIGGPALAHRIAQRPLLQMGIRDGEYRGDVPAVRIADDGLAYQKRRLLRGLARLASCERNGDEDLYGAIWQCSRL